MKARISFITAFVMLFANLAFNGPAQAAEGHMHEMAEIVIGMHHYPDDAQKASLHKIADDTKASPAERTLAGVLLHMEHVVSGDDKQKLQSLMDDKTASESARKLAGVLVRFQHMAAAEDKEILKSIAK